jgi:hypothetical protein
MYDGYRVTSIAAASFLHILLDVDDGVLSCRGKLNTNTLDINMRLFPSRTLTLVGFLPVRTLAFPTAVQDLSTPATLG